MRLEGLKELCVEWVLFLVVVRESLFQKCSTTEDQNYEEEEKSKTS